MRPIGKVTVKDKALKSIAGRHPWVFSGAIRSVPETGHAGDIVDLVDTDGSFLGRGFFNPNSQIAVRILSFEDDDCGVDLIYERLKRAIDLRSSLPEYDRITAWRMVFAESDLLPGLIVDCYSDYAHVKFHSAGWESMKADIARMVSELTGCTGVYDGSDPDMRSKEGLETENQTIYGDDPPEHIVVTEFGRQFQVDIRNGQKSGLYLDQKFNHQEALYYAKNRKVLDAFAYTGGFGIAAVEGGCGSLTCIEISEAATRLLEANIELNKFGTASVTMKTGDAFEIMRDMLSEVDRFDMIILDPPAFCRSKSAIVRACRGYKDINRLAMKLLSPDGILITCSCSRPISDELFLRVLWQASVEAERSAQLLKFAGQPPDHPVLLSFPESKYLKCATLLVQ
jgi:23S rRNA (cytosine1962-C5)-methyltransferase